MEVKYYKKEFIEEYFNSGDPFRSTVEHKIVNVIPCCEDITQEFINQLWLLGDNSLMYPIPVGDEWEIVTPHRHVYCENCGTEIKIVKILDITTDVKQISELNWKELLKTAVMC